MKFTDVMGENKESDIPAWDGFLRWGDGGGPDTDIPCHNVLMISDIKSALLGIFVVRLTS